LVYGNSDSVETRWHVEPIFLCFRFLKHCFNRSRWHVVAPKTKKEFYKTKKGFAQALFGFAQILSCMFGA
jgi:hypothetical protein